MPCVNFLIYDTRNLNPPPYTKVLTIQPQHHTMKNVDIQIDINLRSILNMYFKDSIVIFKILYSDYKSKCDVFKDV
jgi:hypothetical protein